MEFSIAYFQGYLFELLAFYKETIGKSYKVILLTLLLLPSIGILNYFRGFRQNQKLQAVVWIVVVSSLLITVYQYKRINVIMPLDTWQGSISPGWHTYIPEPLSLTNYLLVMGLGIAITAILGRWLGRRFD